MPFDSYAAELATWIPRLDYLLSQKLINRAWRDIRLSYPNWSFLTIEGVLVAPAQIIAGTVSVTQFSPTVTGDATASAAWLPQVLGNPPFTERQFRLPQNPLYGITAVDVSNTSAIVLTLDRPYEEDTAATAQYAIYRAYYHVENVPDFLRFVTVYNPIDGYRFTRTSMAQAEINNRDPRRGALGPPFWIASYKPDADGVPQFEIYPHPTNSASYKFLAMRKGQDFSDPKDTLPPAIDEELLMLRARYRAYEWALSNAGRFPELQESDWRFLMQKIMDKGDRASYPHLLQQARRNDAESFANYINRARRYGPFIDDAAWNQSHIGFYELDQL